MAGMGSNYYAALGMEVARNDGSDYSRAASSSLDSASSSLHNIFDDTSKAFETGKKSVNDLFGILGKQTTADSPASGWLAVSEQLANEEGLQNKQNSEIKQYNNELASLDKKKDELFNLMNNKIESVKDKEKTDLVQKTTGFNSSQDYERNMDIFIADKFSKYNLSKEDLVRMSRFPDTIAIEALKRGIKPADLLNEFNKYKDVISTYSGIKLKEDDINNNIFSPESNRELANDLYKYSKYLYPNKTSQQIYDELMNSQLKNKEDIAKTRYSTMFNNLQSSVVESGAKPEFWDNAQEQQPNSNNNVKDSQTSQVSKISSTPNAVTNKQEENELIQQAQEEFENDVYEDNTKLVNPNGSATQFSIGREQTDMENYKNVITPSILEFNKQTNNIADIQAAMDVAATGLGLARGGFSWSVKNGEIIASSINGKKIAVSNAYDLARQDGKTILGAFMSAGKEARHKFLTGTKAQRQEIVEKINEALPENTRKNLIEFATKHYGKIALTTVGGTVLVNNIDTITDFLKNEIDIVDENEINKALNKDTPVDKSNVINTVKTVNDYYMSENDGRSLFGFGKFKQGSHLVFDVFNANPISNPNVYSEIEKKNSDFVKFFGKTDFDKVEQDLLHIIDNDSYIMGEEYYRVMLDKISIAKNIQDRLKYLATYQKQYNSFNPNSQEYKGINRDITVKQIEGQNLKTTDTNNKEAIQQNKTELEGLNYKQETQKIASINSIVGDDKSNKVNPTMKASYQLLTGKTDIDLNKNKKIDLKDTKENKEDINKNNFIPKVNLDIPLSIFFEKSIHKDADSVTVFNNLIKNSSYKKLVYEFTAKQSTSPSSRAVANFESEIGQLIIKEAKNLGINLRSKGGNGKESGPISTGKTLFTISDRYRFRFADFIVDISKAGKLTQKQFELLMEKYSK